MSIPSRLRKIPKSEGSFLLATVLQVLVFGPAVGLAFSFILLVHEYGHVWQLRREGIPAPKPVFIPFLGAFIALSENPADPRVDARVGLSGPIAGMTASLVLFVLAFAVDSTSLFQAALVGGLLNTFNLLPVYPLDGGRAARVIGRWLWPLGLIGLATLVGWQIADVDDVFEGVTAAFSVLIVLVAALASWVGRSLPRERSFRAMLTATAVWIALVGVGSAMSAVSYARTIRPDARTVAERLMESKSGAVRFALGEEARFVHVLPSERRCPVRTYSLRRGETVSDAVARIEGSTRDCAR